MASQLGWVDQDDKQRNAMIKVVDLFKEDGTVDELGIGSTRAQGRRPDPVDRARVMQEAALRN